MVLCAVFALSLSTSRTLCVVVVSRKWADALERSFPLESEYAEVGARLVF